jgi:hypothetical protein
LRRRAGLPGRRAPTCGGRCGMKAMSSPCSSRTSSTAGASTAGGPKTSCDTPRTSTAPT